MTTLGSWGIIGRAVKVLSALVVFACAFACRPALARAPRKIALHYTRSDAARACADPIDIARRVESYTGPVLVAPAAAEAALEAHVDANKHGYRAQIRLILPGAAVRERVLEHSARACDDFSATLAFVIATTIDPDAIHERVNGLFEPTAVPPEAELLAELERTPPTPVQLAPRVSETRPPPPLPQRHPMMKTLAVAAAVSDEAIRWGMGASATGRLLWRARFGMALGARTVVALGRLEERAQTATFAIDALGCVRRALPGQLSAALCVGPELSGLRARGIDLMPERRGWLWSAGVHARAELALRLSARFGLAAGPFAAVVRARRITFNEVGLETTLGETGNVTFGVSFELQRFF